MVVAAKRDVAAGDLVGLQLEIGDGLASMRFSTGFWPAMSADVARGVGDLVLVGLGIDAGVEDDLQRASGPGACSCSRAMLHQPGATCSV